MCSSTHSHYPFIEGVRMADARSAAQGEADEHLCGAYTDRFVRKRLVTSRGGSGGVGGKGAFTALGGGLLGGGEGTPTQGGASHPTPHPPPPPPPPDLPV